MENKLLKPDEVAAELGVHVKTLAIWRSRGEGPQHVRMGKKLIRYLASDVQKWAETSREVASA